MTLCLHNPNLDPYFNLAAEEHLLLNFDREIFMLWRNQPSIIIGRNQNAYSEINLEYVQKHDVKVIRRLSGGGAVFHDLGNVNFTFIVDNPKGPKLDFERFTEPIINALAILGVEASFEGRNDLMIDGMKVSGNAQHIHKKRILHHGTLLYSSRLSNLNQALKVNPAKFEDKAVKSIRSRVTNISQYLAGSPPVEEFIEVLMESVMNTLPSAERYKWTKADLVAIEALRSQKYASWRWNFGRSPDYSFKNTVRTKAGTIEVHLQIEAGIIQAAHIYGDFFGSRRSQEIEATLVGLRHEPDKIKAALVDYNIGQYIHNLAIEDFVNCLF